ncbi:hypothetical protein J6590_063154 [Homalodisca vitripennis]|nr:hypothetical protein J6590_063154 [Homalodisca vitripennis]
MRSKFNQFKKYSSRTPTYHLSNDGGDTCRAAPCHTLPGSCRYYVEVIWKRQEFQHVYLFFANDH